jgi:hypothetical protein
VSRDTLATRLYKYLIVVVLKLYRARLRCIMWSPGSTSPGPWSEMPHGATDSRQSTVKLLERLAAPRQVTNALVACAGPVG